MAEKALLQLLEKQGISYRSNGRLHIHMRDRKLLGRILADYLGRDKPYTSNYIDMLVNGIVPVSEKIQEAIDGLLAGQTVQTKAVRVVTDYDLDGVIVDIQPRLCKRAGCCTRFIPHSWNHVYCNTECRKKAKK